MEYFNSAALIIIEINQPNKAPDLRHFTLGSSNYHTSDEGLASQIVFMLQSDKSFANGTTFSVRAVHRFTSLNDYIKFLENQLGDYLNP